MREFDCGELHYVFGENGFPEKISLPAVLRHHNLLREPADLTLVLGRGIEPDSGFNGKIADFRIEAGK